MSSSEAASGFPARVAVLSSAGAELIARKNNLAFSDLLQPFCRIGAEGQVRDPSGGQYAVKNFRIAVSNVNSRPPQPTLARKFLNESVSKNYNDRTVAKTVGKFSIDVPAATPWFDAWRETFFQVQFPSDHEFTKHFVACLLVVSASEANPPDVMSQMSQQLSQMQNVTPPKLPKWFNANVLRCYVLLHDNLEGNIEKTRRTFESLKQTYGSGNCFLIPMNSRNPNESDNCALPDPWSKYLVRRVEDTDSGSEKESQSRSPADISNVPIVIEEEMKQEISSPSAESGGMCDSATEASEGGSVTVQVHPLSPSEEIESGGAFDSANSLQNDVMTSSIGSDIGMINPNVWDQTNLGGVHGACLSTQDIENIRNFVQDFSLKALLPYFERQIFQLQDAVSNKKGVSRSIFNVTKRWFGTNKPGTNVPVNSVIYTGDCAELQLRRLGDIWFMLGQWNLAFQTYHTAKREYNSDGAWLCYAGALEMAALSAFMANESSRKTFEYMEESIVKYLNACRMPQYAVRATLLSVQCLCSRGMYSEAARQLIRMTSEDCDLRSAVLLEQAALCFLAEPARKALPRKYAFHMVLAGHRYSKAGQRKHSLRCYKHAYQIYRGGGWRLATDHIEFAVGRLAGQVKAWDASAAALSSLLAPRSLQPPIQQAAFLREYLHILQQWILNDSSNSSLPQLPIPLLENNLTSVLCGGATPVSTPGRLLASGTALTSASTTSKIWTQLEKMLIHKAKGALMIFKPTISLYCSTSDNSSNPIAPQNELIQILVHFQNPLQIDISISDVQLLWQFKSQNSNEAAESFFNENCIVNSTELDKSIANTQKVPLVQLPSDKVTPVTLYITPLHPGELTIVGVAYKLCNPVLTTDESTTNNLSVLGKQIFKIKGPKLKSCKEGSSESQYGADKRLKILVVPPSPCLQVTFSEVSNQLLCGELQRITVEFRNIGRIPLKSLYMGTSHPQHISLSLEEDKHCDPFLPLLDSMYAKPPPIQDERQLQLEKEKKARNRHCIKILDSLDAGQSFSTIIWMKAPEQPGNHKLHALFYYENSQSDSLLKHRLLRHSWNFNLKESVTISATPRRTLKLEDNDSKYKEALNLAVEVKNSNQIHHGVITSIEVQQVSLLSQSWRLKNFVPIDREANILCSQEILHLILCARRDKVKDSEKDLIVTDLNLKLDDTLNIISVRERPYSSFVTNHSSIFDEGELSNDITNVLDNVSLDDESINSTLVIRWKADITINSGAQRVAVGQHCIIINKLNFRVSSLASFEATKFSDGALLKSVGFDASPYTPATGFSKSTTAEERLVTFCLEHQHEVLHNFSKRHVCIVPIKLHLVNCSLKTVTAMLCTSNSKCFGWVGVGGNNSGSLKIKMNPLDSSTINLQVACSYPGTYSLGSNIRVSCEPQQDDGYSEPILQSHVASSMLIVTDNS